MRKLRVGMIGGGGGFIGKVHQRAIALDGTRELVAGALHQDPEASRRYADEWGIRAYPDWQTLLRDYSEGALELDYLVIVTPNHLHYPQALAALKAGLPVFCEKPLCLTVPEAETLAHQVATNPRVPFAISHTYTGHPMLMLARELVRQDRLGAIRKVEAWYRQGWLSTLAEKQGNGGARWRTTPGTSGMACCAGDIGTHALIDALWVAGLGLERLAAMLTSLPGRELDDDCNVWGILSNGATLNLAASQILTGLRNDNGMRISGERGTLLWRQEVPEELHFFAPDCSRTTYYQNALPEGVPDILRSYSRVPSGHNEDFFEALANLHTSFERRIRALKGEPGVLPAYDHPAMPEALLGMKFISAAVTSSRNAGAWTKV